MMRETWGFQDRDWSKMRPRFFTEETNSIGEESIINFGISGRELRRGAEPMTNALLLRALSFRLLERAQAPIQSRSA